MSLFFRINNTNPGYLTNSSLSRSRRRRASVSRVCRFPHFARFWPKVVTCCFGGGYGVDNEPASAGRGSSPSWGRLASAGYVTGHSVNVVRSLSESERSHYIHRGLSWLGTRKVTLCSSSAYEAAMAINCPNCGAGYDVTLFQFGRSVQCACGQWVELSRGHVLQDDRADLPLPRVCSSLPSREGVSEEPGLCETSESDCPGDILLFRRI